MPIPTFLANLFLLNFMIAMPMRTLTMNFLLFATFLYFVRFNNVAKTPVTVITLIDLVFRMFF